MNEILTDKNITCAVTGHRNILEKIDVEKLKNVFIDLINKKYKYFLVGMALGFDTICFDVLYELKKDYDVKIIACVPCESQSKKFSQENKNKYDDMILKSDEVIMVGKEYNRWCMFKRNRFMVENSSSLVAYLREDKGGTKNTVDYAKKNNLNIIYV